MSNVGVVVVSYRTPELTVAAVRSALAVSTVSEVVVVDNAPDDPTVERLRDIDDSRLVVIPNATNVGYGTAANQGVNAARAPLVLFLNSDAVVHADAVAALVAELERHDGHAIVGPRLIGPDGEVQRSSGLLPGPFDLAVRALGLHVVARQLPVVGRLVRRSRTATEYESAATATDSTSTSMVSGAVAAIGTDAFRELGGFDEGFFLYFEDADLCRRAGRAGMAIRYVPRARVSHVGGASSANDYHFGPHHARSMRVYLRKWYGWPGDAVALLLLSLRWLGSSVGRRPGAARAREALVAAMRDKDPRR